MNLFRFFILFTVLTISLTGIVIYKTLQKKYKSNIKQSNSNIISNQPEAILKNFQLQESKIGEKTHWILTAQTGRIFHSLKRIECDNLKCKLLKNEKIIAELNSPNGVIDQKKKEANLNGKVFGNIYDMNIEGKNIKYDLKNHIISSKEKIIYKHPQFKMLANTNLAELKNNKITMENGVETEFSPQSNNPACNNRTD